MNELIELVKSNTILATVTSGSLIVWLFTNLKNIWHSFVNAVLFLISFKIENIYEDNRANGGLVTRKQHAFTEIISSSKVLVEKTRSIDYSNVNRNRIGAIFSIPDKENKDEKKCENCSLTYGFSVRLLNGKLITCNRSMSSGQKTMVTTSIRVFFANKNKFISKLENLVDELIIQDDINKKSTISVINSQSYEAIKNKRNMSSIFTNNNEHVELLNNLKNFIDNKKIYNEMNHPYKYCALLYGKPGTGKSSTILSIASELGRDIRYISMTDMNLTELLDACNDDGNKKICVIEDIDAYDNKINSSRETSDEQKNKELSSLQRISGGKREEMSLSDLLNVTDGLLASDGLIMIFTTNHIENLDDAFLRSGRMDCKIEFDYLNSETANRMIEYHLGYKLDNLKNDIRPAELQEEILNIKIGKSEKQNLIDKFCIK